MPPLTTLFAPPERLSPENIQRQAEYFANTPFLCVFLDAVPTVFLVLNQHRQVIYANQTLLDALHVTDRSLINGRRPGELLGCIHATENLAGCGTSEFCRTCGAVHTILTSLQGHQTSAECRITQRDGTALDLRVSGSPLEIGGQRFALFAVEDISHEKRQAVLERLFLHDVLYEAGVALDCVTQLQGEPAPDEHIAEFQTMLCGSMEHLIDEIQAQRELLAAETGDLTVRPVPLRSRDVLEAITQFYAVHAVGQGRQLVIDRGAQDVGLVCDPRLIERVVGNLVKNALEAVAPGETVSLTCRANGARVTFQVHNPGVIPRETQLKLFQRSFTTKGSGRGLGAYSVKLLAEGYLNGAVSFTSTAEAGTTFSVTLPTGVTVPPP